MDQVAHIVVGQWFELEDARSADQRPDDFEVGILRRRADQDDRAVFDVRQQRILLRFVEAVNLVDEQDGALVIHLQALFGLFDDAADVAHARHHGVDLLEVAARGVGDDHRQRGLARARRPPQQDRGEQPIGLDGAPQEPPRPDDVVLPDVFVERTGAHPRGQRLAARHDRLRGVIEQIGSGRGSAFHGVKISVVNAGPSSRMRRRLSTSRPSRT